MHYNDLISALNQEGSVLCRIPEADLSWGIFSSPAQIISTYKGDEIPLIMEKLETLSAEGKYLAGFIAYEASPFFDPANEVKDSADFPLLWFAVYQEAPRLLDSIEEPNENGLIPLLSPDINRTDYLEKIRSIKKYIYDGDIYQANYTFRFRADKAKTPAEYFVQRFINHPAPYAAFINTADFKIASLSPELFLERNGAYLKSSPMKGTASSVGEAGKLAADTLQADQKNRAENLMITDMVRNDMGRICEFGTVKTEKLFAIETYNTVHQMISTVTGKLRTDTSLKSIFSGLFPPASITGAPKIRAMQLIKELENSPRKIYTGTIGCFCPGQKFLFNVAIRTFLYQHGAVELGSGGGIVADSQPEDEWQECMIKKSFASYFKNTIEILETLLWEKDKGFSDIEEHLERAENTASLFCFKWNTDEIEKKLAELNKELSSLHELTRIRLLFSKNGTIKTEYSPLAFKGWGKELARIRISQRTVSSSNIFLQHKTTARDLYNSEYKNALADGFDEVIFLNEKSEITEGAITNIFVRKNGKYHTPPLHCGLLNGIWRKQQIKFLNATESVIKISDLIDAEEIIIGNSVRGGIKATIKIGDNNVSHFIK